MIRKLFFMTLIAALLLSACDLKARLPFPTQPVGPEVTDQIKVAAPDSAEVTSLQLEFGTGELALAPGAVDLVSGTATYNVADFKPEITVSGSDVTLSQGTYTVTGIPNMNQIKNKWDLKLGSALIDLTIRAGAYEGKFDLGGLSLKNLTIEDGASDVDVDFSAPNKVEMNSFRYTTGASNITLSHLANANFSALIVECGAGNYTLDFSGELQRAASVMIKSGMSNITLKIPAGISAQITVTGALSNVSAPSGWTKNGNTYTQTGSGPTITIDVETGAGNVQISN